MIPDLLIRALAARVAQAHEDAPVIRVDVTVEGKRWAALYQDGAVRVASSTSAPPADLALRLARGLHHSELGTPYQRQVMASALLRLRQRRARVATEPCPA